MQHIVTRWRRRLQRASRAGLAATVAMPLGAAIAVVGAAPASAAPAPAQNAPAARTVAQHPGHTEDEPFKALVFTKTAAFRHGSIPAATAAIEQLGAENGFTVDSTEDATAFTTENLANYEVVIWVSTTGDVLNAEQQAAFESYIENGGGYAGVHAASDTEYDWPWYGDLVGAYFAGHPAIQEADLHVADRVHPSTAGLPTTWTRTDEWYNFGSNPRGDVHVLATLDESTYSPGGGAMGADHPISWCQYSNGGRSWYTGGGHTDASYDEPLFREHLLGGIRWAAGAVSNDCGATKDSNYQKVVLDTEVASPMGLQVAPDGTVFYIERAGQVRTIDPDSSTTTTIGRLPVYTAQENGLLGIELDPAFEDNGWIYVYYSPSDDIIESPHQRLSRFTVRDGSLDMGSESILLQIPHQRVQCCHSGGKLEFDGDGNLWLSTGDDTSPGGAPGGYAPIDERPGQEPFDAQRTAANSADLRGKLLRITPTADGSYTVPAGNLVDTEWGQGQDEGLVRPEIYGMGFRNPFRFSVDQTTGEVYLADYGPDAVNPDPNRGIDGRVEWNRIVEPGNYGWPYCHGGGAYRDYDYATSTPGPTFDCAAPVNTSPNNTGAVNLPPVIEPQISYGRSLTYPVIGTGGAPMGGPSYEFNPDIESARQWPAYFDGVPLFYEWGQNRIYEMHLGESGPPEKINRMLGAMSFNRPHDMVFGEHDGALYMIEWGMGFGGNNDDAQVVRVDYTGGNENPIAKVGATPRSGGVPLEVEFSSAGSTHPQGGELGYAWDFGDGATSTEANPTHTYTREGNFTAVLTVTDSQGRTGTANTTLSVGNNEPRVEVEWPAAGTVFSYGDEIDFDVTVTDVEDGSSAEGGVDCQDVTVELILGHEDHGHPMSATEGCTGSFTLESDGGHVETDRITYAIEARYTDRGSPEGTVAPLTGRDVVALQPARKQSEHFDGSSGVRAENAADPEGGVQNIGFITNTSWIRYDNFNMANIEGVRFRVAAPNNGAAIQVRKDSPTGPILGTATVSSTGGFQTWDWAAADIEDPGGTFDLVLTFTGPAGFLVNLNWMDFVGEGVAGGPPVAVPVPTAQTTPASPDGDDGWFTQPVTVALAPADAETGDSVEYRIEPQAEWTSYTEPVTLEEDGIHVLQYRTVRGTSSSPRQSVEIKIDTTAPESSLDLDPEVADGSFTGTVTVTAAAEDTTSGVGRTELRIDDGPVVVYSGPVEVTGDGSHTVHYRSVDRAGVAEDWREVRFDSPSGQVPTMSLTSPPPAGVVPAGSFVRFEAAVDVDGASCQDVRTRLVVSHGDHEHLGDPVEGCAGWVQLVEPADAGADRVTYRVESTYAEGGFSGEVRNLAQASDSVLVRHQRLQAEHFDAGQSIRTETAGDSLGGGQNIGFIKNGFVVAYSDVNLSGITALRLRLATSTLGGVVEARKDSATGQLLGSVPITNTGGFQSYQWFDMPITDPGGPFKLVLRFTAEDPDRFIANANFYDFVGAGVSSEPEEPIDETAPTTTITLPDADGRDGWHTTRPSFTLAATDETDGSGISSTEYRIAGGAWTPYTGAVEVTGEGSRLVEYRSTDEAGNVEEPGSVTVKIDTAPPVVSAEESGDTTKTVTLTATDATSGVARIEYRMGDATTWSVYDAPLGLDEPGAYQVHYRAADRAGNTAGGQLEVVVSEAGGPVGPAKPSVTMTTAPLAANGRANWFTAPVTVTLAGAGGEGRISMEYRIDNGPWTAYAAPFKVSADGITRVQARATDAAGTMSAIETTTIKMDATAPTVGVTGIADGAELGVDAVLAARVTVIDAASGAAEQQVRLDGAVVSAPVRLEAMSLEPGRHTLEVTVLDAAGNRSSQTVRFRVVVSSGQVRKLVNRLDDQGAVGPRLAAKLKKELKAAKHAEKGKDVREARRALKRFATLAKLVDDKEVRLALKRLSRTLKSQL